MQRRNEIARKRMNIQTVDSGIVSQEARAKVIQETIKKHGKTNNTESRRC